MVAVRLSNIDTGTISGTAPQTAFRSPSGPHPASAHPRLRRQARRQTTASTLTRPSDHRSTSGAIAEILDTDFQLVQQRHIQVRHWRVVLISDVAASLDAGSSAGHQQNGRSLRRCTSPSLKVPPYTSSER